MEADLHFRCEACGARIRAFDGRNYHFAETREERPFRAWVEKRRKEAGALLCDACLKNETKGRIGDMGYTEYAKALQAVGREERGTLLDRARHDHGLSVADYIKLENLDQALCSIEDKKGRKSNEN